MLAVSIMFYLGERNKLRDNNKEDGGGGIESVTLGTGYVAWIWK